MQVAEPKRPPAQRTDLRAATGLRRKRHQCGHRCQQLAAGDDQGMQPRCRGGCGQPIAGSFPAIDGPHPGNFVRRPRWGGPAFQPTRDNADANEDEHDRDNRAHWGEEGDQRARRSERRVAPRRRAAWKGGGRAVLFEACNCDAEGPIRLRRAVGVAGNTVKKRWPGCLPRSASSSAEAKRQRRWRGSCCRMTTSTLFAKRVPCVSAAASLREVCRFKTSARAHGSAVQFSRPDSSDRPAKSTRAALPRANASGGAAFDKNLFGPSRRAEYNLTVEVRHSHTNGDGAHLCRRGSEPRW